MTGMVVLLGAALVVYLFKSSAKMSVWEQWEQELAKSRQTGGERPLDDDGASRSVGGERTARSTLPSGNASQGCVRADTASKRVWGKRSAEA